MGDIEGVVPPYPPRRAYYKIKHEVFSVVLLSLRRGGVRGDFGVFHERRL